MYKLSDKTIKLILDVIQDSNKKDYKIATKKDLEELCFAIALLMGFSKTNSPEEEAKKNVINSALEEIHHHLDEIDYEDLNKRIK